jgi:hypothetical protein
VIAMAAFVSLAMLAVQWHRVERVGGRVKRDALTR